MDKEAQRLDNEIARLEAAVDEFAEDMKAELRSAAANGRRGWDDPACVEGMQRALEAHARNSRSGRIILIHIANFAMFLSRQKYPAK